MKKYYKRIRIIGLIMTSTAGGLMGWSFDGRELVVAIAILILAMLGMSFIAFATLKLEEKSVFVYCHPRLNEVGVTRANTIEEAIDNFEEYYDVVEYEYIYEPFYSEIKPTEIIEKG